MTRFRTWTFAGSGVPVTLGLCALLLESGCATRGNIDVLESQLRKQEEVIHRYERNVAELKSDLTVSQREIDLLRGDLASLGTNATAEELSHNLARVEGIVFNSLLSAGQNTDGIPGDERFHAVFYPHDAHGEIVKLAGKLELEAIDLSRPPQDKTIGRWEFTSEESRQLWHAGFLTSGFQIDLPWNHPPQGSKVLLIARLKTADGRSFEATHSLNVNPVNVPVKSDQIANSSAAPGVQTASFETSKSDNRAPRPEPLPAAGETPSKAENPFFSGKDPFESTSKAPSSGTTSSSSTAQKAPPFPEAIRTSDNWTDETIPQWR